MAKARAYGADAKLRAARETTYGVAPTSDYFLLAFGSTDLSAEQPLGDDPLLGFGRNQQDPYRGLITDEGQTRIPIDVRGTGYWLTGLFGDATVTDTYAAGSISFSGQPANGSTITLGGTVWTFVTGSPSGAQTEIGADLDATLTALATNLGASADANISDCTYTADTAGDALTIVHDTAGTAGNAFTLAASANSNGTVSAETLLGGGYQHEWLSGSDEIPSYTFEVGHPQLTNPVFFRHLGVVLESLTFEMGVEGPANATVQMVAQGEERASVTIDGSAASVGALERFSQGRGFITRGGVALAQITAGSLTFSNNLERVRTIRDDGKIEGADPTIATCVGTATLRFDGATLVGQATNNEPTDLAYGFSSPQGWALTFELFRVFLPKPKYPIGGPGGVEANFDWRAANDDDATTMLRVRLVNDVEVYA